MNPFTKKTIERRKFLKDCGKMSGIGAMSSLINFGMTNKILAARTPGSIANYKATVCIFLGGGLDSFNMLRPGISGYADYTATRNTVALPRIPADRIVDSSTGADYHTHANMRGLRDLFNDGDLSFVAGIGTLVEPGLNRNNWSASNRQRPQALGSHFDQSRQWQNSVPNMRGGSFGGTGWIGRMSEVLNDAANNDAIINMNMSPSGDNLAQTSLSQRPLALRNEAALFEPYVNNQFIRQVTNDDLEATYANVLSEHYNNTREVAINANNNLAELVANTTLSTQFPNTPLGQQLRRTAVYIKLQGELNLNRQTFYCSMGGFDTHGNNNGRISGLLSTVSAAMVAFNAALKEIGYHDRVVTYTASDFGRNLTSNGGGTGHGWGANNIVMGGPITGGRVFGDYPELAATASQIIANSGRVVPTTSIDELHQSIAYWYGVNNGSEMDSILPNIRNFYTETRNNITNTSIPRLFKASALQNRS